MATPSPQLEGCPVHDGTVLPEWIDINDHMNVAYYVLAFDHAVDSLWHRFGIDDEYIRRERNSTFAVECHVTWQRELEPGAPFTITSQVLAYDEKRIHQFMRMYHGEQGFLAATAEWMNLHVDMSVRRVSNWPSGILDGIRGFVEMQGTWPYPRETGSNMNVKQPLFSVEGYAQ